MQPPVALFPASSSGKRERKAPTCSEKPLGLVRLSPADNFYSAVHLFFGNHLRLTTRVREDALRTLRHGGHASLRRVQEHALLHA